MLQADYAGVSIPIQYEARSEGRSVEERALFSLIPTGVSENEFSNWVCLTYLHDRSAVGEIIFQLAFQKTRSIFLSKQSVFLPENDSDGLAGIDIKHDAIKYDVSPTQGEPPQSVLRIRRGSVSSVIAWMKRVGSRMSDSGLMALQRIAQDEDCQIILVASQRTDLGIIQVDGSQLGGWVTRVGTRLEKMAPMPLPYFADLQG